jgi:hypothetical protein
VDLDCETPESTALSIARILGLSVREMESLLNEVSDGDYPVNIDMGLDHWLPMIGKLAGRELEDMESGCTFWFHATRINDFGSFRSGIHPLTRQVDEVWKWLHFLVADRISADEWRRFRRRTERDHYGHSEMVHDAWMAATGPFGFLIAEASLSPGETGNHDYFNVSELVEDISSCFKHEFGFSLKDLHHAATKPALIKFKTKGIKAYRLGAAVDYLVHKKEHLTLCCLSPCFSGEGERVCPDQVIKVIPVEQTRRFFRGHPEYKLSEVNAHLEFGVMAD